MTMSIRPKKARIRHIVAIVFAYGSMIALAIAMLLPPDMDPESELDLPGWSLMIVSVLSVFFDPRYLYISVFTGIMLLSTILILKRGYEGLAGLRIALIGCGAIAVVITGMAIDTQLAAGYWYWLAAFVLSALAHLCMFRRGGTLVGTYEFEGEL